MEKMRKEEIGKGDIRKKELKKLDILDNGRYIYI
jgi:hypothetical protein